LGRTLIINNCNKPEKQEIPTKKIRALFLRDLGILKLNFTLTQKAKKIPENIEIRVTGIKLSPKLKR